MRQLSAIFLIALVLGSNAAAVSEQSNDFATRNPEFQSLMEEGSEYIVDRVLNLLKNLEDAAHKDLHDLEVAWAKQKAYLEDVLAKATLAYNRQVALCNRLEAEQHHLEHEIAWRVAETQRNVAQIAADGRAVKIINAQRCKENGIFVDHLVDHRDALGLFAVLKKAIEAYGNYQYGYAHRHHRHHKHHHKKHHAFKNNKRHLAKVALYQIEQLDSVEATLGDYINVFAQEHAEEFNEIMSQMRRLTSSSHQHKRVVYQRVRRFANRRQYRTAGRVVQRANQGVGHVDNGKKQIRLRELSQRTVRALQQVKLQLNRLLDRLIALENAKKENDDLLESRANEHAAQVKKGLQDEQRRLTRRNEELARQLAVLRVLLARKIRQVIRCRAQERRLLAAKNAAQRHLDAATRRFLARKAVLQGEIKLFNHLYIYYRNRVYNVATSADRQRVQDYAKNKNFKKSASYTAGQADAFNADRGNYGRNAHRQAVKNVGF